MIPIEPCPKTIATALHGIMSDIKTLEKDSENSFQKYNYVDVDSFLKALNPLCSKHGLTIFMNEKSCNIVGDAKKWLHITYEFILVHSSGDTWLQPIQKNMIVQMTGGQSLGASQSYSLKQFMRQVFLIPTGDKDDLDAHEQNFQPKKKEYQNK